LGVRPRRIASRPALSRAFTLIELIVVICLVAIFVAVAGNRLRLYQEAAEKARVQLTVASMQSGLQLQVAALLIKGDAKGIMALQGANPVRFLDHPPAGYAGEFSQAEASLPGRTWYFDRQKHELVYVPDLRAHLSMDDESGGMRLRFQTRINYDAGSGRGPAAGGLQGARIVPAVSYVWFDSAARSRVEGASMSGKLSEN